MNLAISTVILFILLLPGLVYRRFYYTEEFSKEYVKQNFYELFLSSFIPSIVFHAIWFYLTKIFGYTIDIKAIASLFYSEQYNDSLVNSLQNSISPVIIYNCTIFLFSAISGYLAKKLVRYFRLDTKKKIFRFKNSWHYLFSGEYLRFPKTAIELTKDNVEDIELVYVDTLIETSEGTMIYEGILVDYELSTTGGLNYFILKMVRRRLLKDDPSETENTERHYNIPGHSMVIQYDKVVNLNLTFYKLEKKEEDSETYYLPKVVS